jgi:hypothetical protein
MEAGGEGKDGTEGNGGDEVEGTVDDRILVVFERTLTLLSSFELGLRIIERRLTKPFFGASPLSPSPFPSPSPLSLEFPFSPPIGPKLSSIADKYGLTSVVTNISCFKSALSDIPVDASPAAKFSTASNGRCVGSVGGRECVRVCVRFAGAETESTGVERSWCKAFEERRDRSEGRDAVGESTTRLLRLPAGEPSPLPPNTIDVSDPIESILILQMLLPLFESLFESRFLSAPPFSKSTSSSAISSILSPPCFRHIRATRSAQAKTCTRRVAEASGPETGDRRWRMRNDGCAVAGREGGLWEAMMRSEDVRWGEVRRGARSVCEGAV